MELFPNTDDLTYYTVIKVYDKNRNIIKAFSWQLPFHLSVKYNWYFKYRHALLQVKYPKFEVTTYSGRFLKKEPELQKNLDNKIRKQKGTITGLKNKLERARELASNELFGIEEEPIVIEFKKKIAKNEQELIDLQNISIKDFYTKFSHRYPDVDINKL